MISLVKKKFVLRNVKFCFFKKNNVVILKNILGSLKVYMPAEYWWKYRPFGSYSFLLLYARYKMKRKTTKFLFINRNMFKMFITNFMFFFNKCFRFYFFKLRLRGLGYRIKKITTKLYRFFFAFNHYFYFHISKDIFFKHKKRNLIIFSNNLVKLNDIFSHLLLLKKLDLYERNNTFIISKKILFFKKRK